MKRLSSLKAQLFRRLCNLCIMAQPQPQRIVSKPTPTVLIPEILSFSPHFLLDDTINIANDGVGRAVDAMEDFLNRWAETRLERDPEWAEAADKELEQGLVSFQTLLEFHTDIAFDFFEAWSLRNIFAVTPPDLPLVVPHQACLDLDRRPPEKEAELLAEIDELRRKVENVTLLPTRVSLVSLFILCLALAAKVFETTADQGGTNVQTAHKTSTDASGTPFLHATRTITNAPRPSQGHGRASCYGLCATAPSSPHERGHAHSGN